MRAHTGGRIASRIGRLIRRSVNDVSEKAAGKKDNAGGGPDLR